MNKTSYRVLALTVTCMLFLASAAQRVIAWPCTPTSCPDCETCTETGCEDDCGAGESCCDDTCCNTSTQKCCDDIGGDDDGYCCNTDQECCEGECCDPDQTCCDGTCCNTSTQKCCDDIGGANDGYCCDPNDICCKGNCCDPNLCEDCNTTTGECECAIDVNSVSSDKDSACVDCNVTFTAVLDKGSCSCVDWSGGGDPATDSNTCTFITHWDSPGTKTVTATPHCGDSKQKQVTIAEPTNFRETYREDLGNGVLYFEYMWDSTSGNLAHLSGCKVGEKVDFPNGDPFYWPSPPWLGSTRNPITNNLDATAGGLSDTHTTKPFVKPYQAAAFSASQIYRYRSCTGSYTTLMGPISINRYVTGEGSVWRYSITKCGAYAEILPLP